MWLDLTWPTALAHLGNLRLRWEDEVVPARFPSCSDSPYRAGYDWLWQYERRLGRALAPYLGRQRSLLIGPRGLLSEALSNAFCHGHGRDGTRPIRVETAIGDAGLGVSVVDQGPGFDVAGLLARLRAGRRYYQVAGNGFRRMVEAETFGVFYGDGGRRFAVLSLPIATLARLGPAPAPPPAEERLPSVPELDLPLSSRVIQGVVRIGSGPTERRWPFPGGREPPLRESQETWQAASALARALDLGRASRVAVGCTTHQLWLEADREAGAIIALLVQGDPPRPLVLASLRRIVQWLKA
jgi:hypothetical protein